MSTAAATTTVTDAAPPAKGKKKLIILVAVALLVLLLGAGAAFMLLKKKPVDPEAADAEDGAAAHASVQHDAKHAPVFVPLDAFTVNLADRDAERYVQVGITLEVEDSAVGDRIKSFMPAIRNNILMTLADRTAGELQGREGKQQLAEMVRREASRALGVDVSEEGAARKKRKAAPLPIKAVHFSNFIIQ